MESNLLVLFFLLFFRSSFQQQHQSLPLNSTAERAALLQLRASLGLRASEWPRRSDPCLTWIGLVCEDGRVVGINISGFKRTPLGNQNPKFSVDALANFTKLVSFNASGFSLPGSIPNWLGLRLQTLTFLDLRFCEISGAIPSTIGNMSNLSELYLSDNNLNCTIPSTLSLLSNLSVLDLSRNSLNGTIPTQLSNLTSLIILDLSSNLLSGTPPSEFGNLRNLKKLMIHNNNFTGNLPDSLCSLPALTFLDASVNNFMGSLPNLSSNPNFTMAVFNLSHNKFYGALTISSILKRVTSIDLCYNYLQGEIPHHASGFASLDKNCFRNWSSQRTLKECAGFYSMKGLPFHNFGLPNPTFLSPILNHKTSRKKLILGAILGGVVLILFFVLFMMVIPLILCSNKKKKKNQKGKDSCGLNSNLSGLGEVIGYEKILVATNEFNDTNLIKNGHSGDIFKGFLGNGIQVIVKRFYVNPKKKRCIMELDFFSKVCHPRLVPLLGHCLEKEKEKFLVYKYMPKGDLSSCLCRKNGVDDDICFKPLDWITRLKIATGAAEILSYLHHECDPPFVHRDVQASSILLDDKYEVRLGSLSMVCIQKENSHRNRLIQTTKTSEKGGPGVGATCAYDVYCFGKVLLELVTGKIGISASSDPTSKTLLENTVPYISIHDKQLVTNIMDPLLIVDEDLLREVWAVAVVAKSCLNPKPSRRPVMRFVLKALENPLKVVREEQMRLGGEGRVDSPRRSWNASWRFGSADVAGGSECGTRWRDRCLSIRRHSKDVVPMDMECEERLNEDWD